jgi:hypothetical protein
MTKNKIHLIVFLALAAFLLLAGTLFFFNFFNQKKFNALINQPKNVDNSQPSQSSGQEQNNNSVTENNPAVPAKAEKDKTALDFAEDKKDVGECLKIKDENYRNMCVILLAQNLQNKTICANIDEEKSAAYCVDQALFEKAVENNKISSCLEIKDESLNYSCIMKVVGQANVKKSDCEVLPEKERKYCFSYFSYNDSLALFRQAKSQSDCQAISDAGLKEQCLSEFR